MGLYGWSSLENRRVILNVVVVSSPSSPSSFENNVMSSFSCCDTLCFLLSIFPLNWVVQDWNLYLLTNHTIKYFVWSASSEFKLLLYNFNNTFCAHTNIPTLTSTLFPFMLHNVMDSCSLVLLVHHPNTLNIK